MREYSIYQENDWFFIFNKGTMKFKTFRGFDRLSSPSIRSTKKYSPKVRSVHFERDGIIKVCDYSGSLTPEILQKYFPEEFI